VDVDVSRAARAAGLVISDAVIIAVVIAVSGAVAPTVAALAAWRQSKINGNKADVLAGKTAEIHDLTNSNLSAVKAELAAAKEEIHALQAVIARLDAAPLAAAEALKATAVETAIDLLKATAAEAARKKTP